MQGRSKHLKLGRARHFEDTFLPKQTGAFPCNVASCMFTTSKSSSISLDRRAISTAYKIILRHWTPEDHEHFAAGALNSVEESDKSSGVRYLGIFPVYHAQHIVAQNPGIYWKWQVIRYRFFCNQKIFRRIALSLWSLLLFLYKMLSEF